jgi:beta-galactosidase GanA
MMPFIDINQYDVADRMDMVQYDHYDFFEGFRNAAFFFDYLRPIKDRPFWNMETATCWAGSTISSGYSEPGFCIANSWLPIAMGGEANSYWLWRTHWAGQELEAGSILYTSGRPRHIFKDVQELSEGFRKCSAFLNDTRPDNTGLAVHMSHLACLTFKNQQIQWGFDYVGSVMERIYHPLIRAQYRPDVIDARINLDKYRLLISPFLACLDDHGLRERLLNWISNGGTWIAGPFADIRTLDATKFKTTPFGSLEEWGGIYCREQFPGTPRKFAFRCEDGSESAGDICFDAFELRGAEALATYTENELNGLAAVTRHRLGDGQVITLGTALAPDDFMALVSRFAQDARVSTVANASSNLVVVPRSGPGGTGAVLVEVDSKPAYCTLPHAGVNLLTGEPVEGRIDLLPYAVAVIKYGK